MNRTRVRTIVLSATVLVALLAIIAQLMLGPSRAPWDMDDCLRAYKRARVYEDTLNVDAHSFPGPQGDTARRCGALRGKSASVPAVPSSGGNSIHGIWWSADQPQSAAFEIKDSTINFPDALVEFRYERKGDTVVVHRDDGEARWLVSRVTADTLVLVMYEKQQIFSRTEPKAP